MKQEKYHSSELSIFRKNYQQKLDVLERNYQESMKGGRLLQEKVDNLTLVNLQLITELKRWEENGFDNRVGMGLDDHQGKVNKSYYMESQMVNQRFMGS